MKHLIFSNEQLLNQAKEERDEILKKGREIKEKLIEDAKQKAGEEAARIVESAKESIQNEKMAAMVDLKNQIAKLSIEIAEKLLGHELSDPQKQKELVDKLIKEAKLN